MKPQSQVFVKGCRMGPEWLCKRDYRWIPNVKHIDNTAEGIPFQLQQRGNPNNLAFMYYLLASKQTPKGKSRTIFCVPVIVFISQIGETSVNRQEVREGSNRHATC